MERGRIIAMYSAYPEALEALVAQTMGHLYSEEDRIVHNVAQADIGRLFTSAEARRLLWSNIARAIIDTATTTTGEKHGKA